MRKDFDVTGLRQSTLARLDRNSRLRSKAHGSCFAWAAALLLVATLANAEARPSPHDAELERWVFSGGLEAGLYGTTADGDFSGTPLVGPRATNLNASDDVDTLVRSQEDSGDVLSGLVGGNFEIMTPGWLDVPTQPRLFMDLSLLGVLSSETSVARIGDPGEFSIPDGIPLAAPFVGELILRGHGTQITSQHQNYQLHAGLGAAFTFDFEEERVRIKPSFVYSRTQNRISAEASRAVRIVNFDPFVGNMRLRTLDHYRLIYLADDFTKVYHGIGPALEVEYDTRNRIGPFLLSIFLKGAGSYLLGDRETEFLLANPEFPEETVRFHYKNDRWAYRATTGVRFRFVPKLMR